MKTTINNHVSRILLFGTTLPVLLASCDDSGTMGLLPDAPECAMIGFTIGDKPQSRSAIEAGRPFSAVMRTENRDDSLFVTETVSDIEASTASRGAVANDINSFYATCAFRGASATSSSYLFADRLFVRPDGAAAGSIWNDAGGAVYYWSGIADDVYTFYAYSPGTDGTFEVENTAAGAPIIHYTCPAGAGQKDIVLATPGRYAGTTGTAIPLQFSHICTVVQIKAGDDMAAGIINSITFTGVKDTGTFSMANTGAGWQLADTETAYTINTDYNTAVSGSIKDITPANNCFVLLPQTLGPDAAMHVSFTSGGTTRTFSVQIGGQKWLPGKKHTYTLTINPDLTVVVDPSTTPEGNGKFIDAHYEKFKVTVHADNLPAGASYVMSCPSVTNEGGVTFISDADMMRPDTQGDNASEENPYKYIRAGYWVNEIVNGSSRSSGRGSASIALSPGENVFWVMVPENNSGQARQIKLELSRDGRHISEYNTVTQYAPYAGGAIGGEHFDTSSAEVWGFMWGGSVTFTLQESSGLLNSFINRLISVSLYNNRETNGIQDGIDGGYVTVESGRFLLFWTYYKTITINYDKVALTDVAQSPTDGHANTDEIYNFKGFGNIASLETLLSEATYFTKSGSAQQVNPSQFAVMQIAKGCNKWDLIYTRNSENNRVVIVYSPRLTADGLQWYLPASGQCDAAVFEGASGRYWTSTAVSGGHTESYYYTVGGNVAPALRSAMHKVRSVRNKN